MAQMTHNEAVDVVRSSLDNSTVSNHTDVGEYSKVTLRKPHDSGVPVGQINRKLEASDSGRAWVASVNMAELLISRPFGVDD